MPTVATNPNATLTIGVTPDFRNALKIQAITKGETLKDYVTKALIRQFQEDSEAEDKIWGEMSEKSKASGTLSKKDSEELLDLMKSCSK